MKGRKTRVTRRVPYQAALAATTAASGTKTRVTRSSPSEVLVGGPGASGRKTRVTRRGQGFASAATTAASGTTAEGECVDLHSICLNELFDVDEVRQMFPKIKFVGLNMVHIWEGDCNVLKVPGEAIIDYMERERYEEEHDAWGNPKKKRGSAK